MIPKIHLVAFEDRDPAFIFVGVPDDRGRYLRTDRSVALAACSRCGAMLGEPCMSKTNYHGMTHVDRRKAAGVQHGAKGRADDILIIEPMEAQEA